MCLWIAGYPKRRAATSAKGRMQSPVQPVKTFVQRRQRTRSSPAASLIPPTLAPSSRPAAPRPRRPHSPRRRLLPASSPFRPRRGDRLDRRARFAKRPAWRRRPRRRGGLFPRPIPEIRRRAKRGGAGRSSREAYPRAPSGVGAERPDRKCSPGQAPVSLICGTHSILLRGAADWGIVGMAGWFFGEAEMAGLAGGAHG